MSELQVPELEASLRDAIKEVLGTTLGDNPEFIPPDESIKGLSAIIEISGGMSGYLALHVTSEDACKVAETMLDCSYPDVDDIVCDAIGELANMLGGSLKKFSGRYIEPFKISVPKIVRGKDYETHAAKDTEQVLLCVKAISLRFTMQLVVYSC